MKKTLTREVLKEEALARLAILKEKGMTYSPAIRCFREGRDIGIFENQGGIARAVYYELNLNTGDEGFYDKLKAEVERFEKDSGGMVYLITVSHTMFGTLCDFFYVSQEKGRWASDRKDLKNGLSLVYCYNMDDDMCSEFGSIAFDVDRMFGGIYRN